MAATTAAPQISQDARAVDYFDLQPGGIGLRLVASSDGFDAFLVLDRAPDQRRFSFVIDAPGLDAVSIADGSIALVDASGSIVGRLPAPLLLDSSDVDGNGGGYFSKPASISVRPTPDGKSVLTISLQKRLLDETVYPAFVALSLVDFPTPAAGAQLATVSSREPQAPLHYLPRPGVPGLSEMWVGHQPQSKNDNAAYLRFDELLPTLGTVDVASASLELLPFAQKDDLATTLVSRVAGDWDAASLTWDGQPVTDATSAGPPAVSWTSGAGSWSTLDVSGYATDVLSRGMPDYGLALSGNGSGGASWKRIVAGGGAADDLGPRLVVTWSGLRPQIDGSGASESAAALPSLSWQQPQIAPRQTRFEVQVSPDGFASIALDSKVKGTKGAHNTWTPAAAQSLLAGTYQWRVRTSYAGDRGWSPWSTARSLTIVPVRAAELLALD